MSKIVMAVATIEKRKDMLPKMLQSVINQTVKPDVIHVYANDYKPEFNHPLVDIYCGEDLTDNGKFYWVNKYDSCFYFSLDDDILYPDNYIENTLHYLEKYPKHVITYHGRKLQGKGLNYYKQHKHYSFARTVKGNWDIDVPGSGVMAFHGDLVRFDPLTWDKYKMSDILFALECAKQEVPILCVQHEIWWLKSLISNAHYSIYKECNNNCKEQNELADKIWDIKYS